MNSLRHFHEEGFVCHAARLPDAEYSMVLDNVVVACCEAIPLHGGKVLLGFRNDEPMSGTWCTMGGKKIPGESFGATCARLLLREIGLTIAPDRFTLLPVPPISVVWAKRAQVPIENGCHMETSLNIVKLTDDEVSLIKPDPSHEKLQWFNLYDIVAKGQERFHPWVARAMNDVFTWSDTRPAC